MIKTGASLVWHPGRPVKGACLVRRRGGGAAISSALNGVKVNRNGAYLFHPQYNVAAINGKHYDGHLDVAELAYAGFRVPFVSIQSSFVRVEMSSIHWRAAPKQHGAYAR
jgi:hypothetical protein